MTYVMPDQPALPADMVQRVQQRNDALLAVIERQGIEGFDYSFELDEYGNTVLVYLGARERAYWRYRRLRASAEHDPRFAILATHDDFTRITVAIAR